MPKMTLPPVNLDLTLEKGRQRAVTEAATGKSTEYVVRVDQLRTIPGFNVRVRETAEYRAHLDALKQSIRENGFYANKPLAGYIGKDGDEDVIYVTDGHTRLEAVNEINAEDVDGKDGIEGLPIVLKPADSNIADLTIALVQDNSGAPLTPYEMGVVVQRLQNMKTGEEQTPLFTKAEIARKLSITERYIDDLNLLVSAPAKVRNFVLEGNVSSTLAIQELRRSPKKAEERLTAAVTKAKAQGKSKATKKHISAVKMQTIRETISIATGDSIKDVLKAAAAKVREVVGHDDADVLTTDGTLTVVIQVPAPEKAPAEPKAAKATPAKKAPAKGKATGSKAKSAGKKAATTPTPAEVTSGDKPAIPLASDDEGEPAKLPPKVPTVDVDNDPDNI